MKTKIKIMSEIELKTRTTILCNKNENITGMYQYIPPSNHFSFPRKIALIIKQESKLDQLHWKWKKKYSIYCNLIYFMKICKLMPTANSIIANFLLFDLNLHFDDIFNNLKFKYLGSSES